MTRGLALVCVSTLHVDGVMTLLQVPPSKAHM
jgi:hypothetical protein